MFKIIVLFAHPEDEAAFDDYFTHVHLPLGHKVPGVVGISVNKAVSTALGSQLPFYQLVEISFPDRATFELAIQSPEFAAASEDILRFASNIVTLFVAEESGASSHSS